MGGYRFDPLAPVWSTGVSSTLTVVCGVASCLHKRACHWKNCHTNVLVVGKTVAQTCLSLKNLSHKGACRQKNCCTNVLVIGKVVAQTCLLSEKLSHRRACHWKICRTNVLVVRKNLHKPISHKKLSVFCSCILRLLIKQFINYKLIFESYCYMQVKSIK